MSDGDASDAGSVDTGGVIVGLAVFAIVFGNGATSFGSRTGVAGVALAAGLLGYGGYVLVARQEE